jgi:uncharacterized protein
MIIQHRLPGKKGMFYVELEGVKLAELVYNMPSSEKMIIEHTEVGDALSGKNVGYQLVATAIDYARQHDIKIIPLCTFAKALIDKTPAFQDVLWKPE